MPVPAPVLCVEIERHPDLSKSPSQCEPKETHVDVAAPRTVSFSSTELSIDDLLMTDAPPLPNPFTVVKGCTRTKKTTTNYDYGRKRKGKVCKAEGCANRAIQGEDSAFGMGPRLTARYAAVRGARAMSFEQESASSTVHVHIQDKV